MVKRQFIFFDVGNTLLFPNRARMLAPLPQDRHPTLETWQALERRTKQEFDQGLMGGKVDHGFWWTFHTYLLQGLNALEDSVRDQLVENTQNLCQLGPNFARNTSGAAATAKGVCDRRYLQCRGRIDAVLRRCGIADCFSSITDSGNVGHEKPHPAIFEAALREMKAEPAESLYVGDVYLSTM